MHDALVMIVNCYGEGLLSLVLSYDVLVEPGLDLIRPAEFYILVHAHVPIYSGNGSILSLCRLSGCEMLAAEHQAVQRLVVQVAELPLVFRLGFEDESALARHALGRAVGGQHLEGDGVYHVVGEDAVADGLHRLRHVAPAAVVLREDVPELALVEPVYRIELLHLEEADDLVGTLLVDSVLKTGEAVVAPVDEVLNIALGLIAWKIRPPDGVGVVEDSEEAVAVAAAHRPEGKAGCFDSFHSRTSCYDHIYFETFVSFRAETKIITLAY